MKRTGKIFILCTALLLLCGAVTFAQDLPEKLIKAGMESVTAISDGAFKARYECTFVQSVDHRHPSRGEFRQRVFVMHAGYDRPTVVVTEGYGADYAARERYHDEVADLLNANVVFVEHRYFGPSTPEKVNWKYMTGRQAAADIHEIVTALKSIYRGKWIATGVSKGGQNSVIYTSFYPRDVDVTVPYVAPLCRSLEDGRHEPFIAGYAGTKPQRDSIFAFQMLLLDRRDELMPCLDSLSDVKGYVFPVSREEIYDYCVLEFPFAFWQWGRDVKEIPSPDASASELFAYFDKVAGADYFDTGNPHTPFHVQAAKELGYYGYDLGPYREKSVIKSTKGYHSRLFTAEAGKFRFDAGLYRHLLKFITGTRDSKIMFVYGQYDPWSAVRFPDPAEGQDNVRMFIVPGGSHSSRIRNMPEPMRTEAVNLLRGWLED